MNIYLCSKCNKPFSYGVVPISGGKERNAICAECFVKTYTTTDRELLYQKLHQEYEQEYADFSSKMMNFESNIRELSHRLHDLEIDRENLVRSFDNITKKKEVIQ